MAQFNRRDFLKLSAGAAGALPMFRMAWPKLASSLTPSQQASGDAPNILVLVFDTLSAKHVSVYGYERETTPNLARFAEKATVFHNHQASANFTSPGTASMLTGTYPWSHRAFHLHGLVNEIYTERNIFNQLPDNYYKTAYTHNLLVFSLLHQFRHDLTLLKQTRDLCLDDLQFADRAFFDDYSAAFWGEWLALHGGASPGSSLFLSILDRGRRFLSKSSAERELGELYPRGVPNLHSLYFLLEDAVDWIGAEVATMPEQFFAYFHLLPPHEPYTTHRDYVDIFREDGFKPPEKTTTVGSQGNRQGFLNGQRREYDEFLAFTDAELGRLLNMLEESGRLDNTYVVITSDHGELFERGIRGHVTPTLYDPLVHVPLLIAKPGQTERVDVQARTSCVDLLPTFMHLTGQPTPEWAEGQLLPTFGDAVEDSERSVFSLEAKSNPKQAQLNKATAVISKGDYKLIHYVNLLETDPENAYELYDLTNDPEELSNIVASKTAVADDLKAELLGQLEAVNQQTFTG